MLGSMVVSKLTKLMDDSAVEWQKAYDSRKPTDDQSDVIMNRTIAVFLRLLSGMIKEVNK